MPGVEEVGRVPRWRTVRARVESQAARLVARAEVQHETCDDVDPSTTAATVTKLHVDLRAHGNPAACTCALSLVYGDAFAHGLRTDTLRAMGHYRLALIAVLAAAMCACPAAEPTLIVELRSDFVPGLEVVRARTFVSTEGRVVGMGDADLFDADLLGGTRIAEIDGLATGNYVIVLDLEAPDGRTIFTRRVHVSITGYLAVTIIASRGCQEVRCPGTGDPPEASECLGRQCVPPTCLRGEDEGCGGTECTDEGDCMPPPATCAEAQCVMGACLSHGIDGACSTGEVCSPTLGCVEAATRPDAGAPDGGRVDASAADASFVDAGPMTCTGGCDDGNPCTHSDHCEGGGCTGSSYSCSDPGDCRTASCDGSGGCSLSGGCGPGSVCSGGGCVACGGVDQICCAAGGCNSGLWCYTGVCTCGQRSGPCCPWDGSCAGGLTCGGGTCCLPLGGDCSAGGPCCDGVPCRSGICIN